MVEVELGAPGKAVEVLPNAGKAPVLLPVLEAGCPKAVLAPKPPPNELPVAGVVVAADDGLNAPKEDVGAAEVVVEPKAPKPPEGLPNVPLLPLVVGLPNVPPVEGLPNALLALVEGLPNALLPPNALPVVFPNGPAVFAVPKVPEKDVGLEGAPKAPAVGGLEEDGAAPKPPNALPVPALPNVNPGCLFCCCWLLLLLLLLNIFKLDLYDVKEGNCTLQGVIQFIKYFSWMHCRHLW